MAQISQRHFLSRSGKSLHSNTQFETNVLPVVVASKEQEPQLLIYHSSMTSSCTPAALRSLYPEQLLLLTSVGRHRAHKRDYLGKLLHVTTTKFYVCVRLV